MDLKHKHWALIFVGLLVAILVVIAGWYLWGSQKVFAPVQMTSSSPQTATTTASTAPAAHIIEHAKYYDIDMAYPSATPLISVSAEANAKAVSLMRAALQETSDQFQKGQDFGNISPEDAAYMHLDERKQALGAEYKAYTGDRSISYVFQIYEDTHGAHPNTFYRTFTFDTQSGKPLQLSDLFTSGVNYLDLLSNIAAVKLPAIIAAREQVSVSDIQTDYLKSGITPEPESFQSWYIQDKTLTLVFPPYQVGPYALGTVELPILFSQLTTLRAEYNS